MIPADLRSLPPDLLARLELECAKDWRRVTRNPDGSITVHNRPVDGPVPFPTPEPEPKPVPAPEKPQKAPDRRDPRSMEIPVRQGGKVTGKGLRARAENHAATAPPPAKDAATRLRELLPPAPEPARPPAPREEQSEFADMWQGEPATELFTPGMYTGDITTLRQKIEEVGFQGQFKYHPEVMALEGMPLDDARATIRNPLRVEIRPETKSKGYPVLCLSRGDIQVIMGFERRHRPAVIACYWIHLLGHDDGRYNKGASGAGGAKKEAGLPNTPAKVIRRLKEMGVDMPDPEETQEKTVECTFRGEKLGRITVGIPYPKGTPESDYQRMLRKVNAIERRGIKV